MKQTVKAKVRFSQHLWEYKIQEKKQKIKDSKKGIRASIIGLFFLGTALIVAICGVVINLPKPDAQRQAEYCLLVVLFVVIVLAVLEYMLRSYIKDKRADERELSLFEKISLANGIAEATATIEDKNVFIELENGVSFSLIEPIICTAPVAYNLLNLDDNALILAKEENPD